MGTISRVTDSVYAFKLARLLTTDWEEWDAFKNGILDENGARTKKKITKSSDKSSWTFFHRASANLKRLMDKVPGGSTKLGKALSLFKLFSESVDSEEDRVFAFAEAEAEKIIQEAVVAGDSGGSSQNMASGETTGNIALKPSTLGKKKKRKIKSFLEFDSK